MTAIAILISGWVIMITLNEIRDELRKMNNKQ